jgi:division protein CdvB (Snf7/Vps24/ESCRT-III family)
MKISKSSSYLFRLRSRLETLQANRTVVASIEKINQEMEKTMQSKFHFVNIISSHSLIAFFLSNFFYFVICKAMDLQKISNVMEKFEKNFEDLDVVKNVMENGIDSVCIC